MTLEILVAARVGVWKMLMCEENPDVSEDWDFPAEVAFSLMNDNLGL